MKINIANPVTGCQKLFDFEDEKKLRIFYEKRISQEVDATPLGEQFKGYVLKITGGNDKQGFPMKQGVLANGRVRVLLDGTTGNFRKPTHDGERKRRTVRGCIVGADLSLINTIIVKKGTQEIEGLTDKTIPRRLGPKRASKIRKLFNLSKEDDVRKYVIRRPVTSKKTGKTKTKAPKIQRLVTSVTIQRERRRLSAQKKQWAKVKAEKEEFAKMMETRKEAAKKQRQEEIQKKIDAKTAAKKACMRAQAKQMLKKIAKRAAYVEKVKARIPTQKLDKKQKKDARANRVKITKERQATLKSLAAMRMLVKKKLARAQSQLVKTPSSKAHQDVRRLKREAHEIYLRIMSGARLPNLRRQERLLKKRKVQKVQEAKAKALKLKIKARKAFAKKQAAKLGPSDSKKIKLF